MKKLIFPLAILLFFSFTQDSEIRLDPKDKEWIMKHLTETREHMKQVLDGLSDEQLDYKPDPTSWSIAENVEHLALTEKMFIESVHKSVADGPNPSLKDSNPSLEDSLLSPGVLYCQAARSSRFPSFRF